MDHVRVAIDDLARAVKKANGRRKRRLMTTEEIIGLELPANESCKVFRDWTIDGYFRRGRFIASKRPGRATAVLLFRADGKTYVIVRAVKCNLRNGFTDVMWAGRMRSKIDPFQCETCQPLWLPTKEDLQVYSDYCEERGLARVA